MKNITIRLDLLTLKRETVKDGDARWALDQMSAAAALSARERREIYETSVALMKRSVEQSHGQQDESAGRRDEARRG